MCILDRHTQGAVVGLGTRVRQVGSIGYLPRPCSGLACKETTCVSFLACRKPGRITRFTTDIDKPSITLPSRVIPTCPRRNQLCHSTDAIFPKLQFLLWTITSSTSSICRFLTPREFVRSVGFKSDSTCRRSSKQLPHLGADQFELLLFALRAQTFSIHFFSSAIDMKLTICSGRSFARSKAATPSSMLRSSVNDRFCATRSDTSSGHRNALRAASGSQGKNFPAGSELFSS